LGWTPEARAAGDQLASRKAAYIVQPSRDVMQQVTTRIRHHPQPIKMHVHQSEPPHTHAHSHTQRARAHTHTRSPKEVRMRRLLNECPLPLAHHAARAPYVGH